ncbi:MAG TPA: glycosyltransferase, partial [Candidatus Saccharimonadales bacterium]
MNQEDQKKVEQAEYRTKLIQAELNAVKSSKAYRLSKTVGVVMAKIKSDPVGLSKKAALVLLTNPKKARHLFRSVNKGAFIAQSVSDQTAKYQEWILLNEPDESELDNQRVDSEKLKYQPLISIITPVFNPPVDVLEELIESVLEQTYSRFELCLGDFGDNREIGVLIKKYAELDNRIQYYNFSENIGIAGNSNQLLDKARGDYIALLDHDDTISPNALYENASLLNIYKYDFIYSDKDKIDESGNRFDPLFKAELSPEMLLNVNYLTHLNVMSTSLVRKIGGWATETDGAQDWDLFLRVIAESKKVGFIPKVLYHWRVIATSTAMSIDTKPYALSGQRKAIDKHLVSLGIPATAYHQKTELFLKWKPESLDQDPVVFINYSNITNTLRTIRSVKKSVINPRFVVLIKDSLISQTVNINSNMKGEVLIYKSDDLATPLNNYLKKFPKSPNKTTAIFLYDNYKLPKKSDWYNDLTGWLNIPEVAAVSGRLVNRHDLIVSSGAVITPSGNYFPLFNNYPRYYQSYIGNAEWVRNLTMLSSTLFATNMSYLQNFDFASLGARDWCSIFETYFLSLTKKHRLVMTPHVTADVFKISVDEEPHSLPESAQLLIDKPFKDPFSTPNTSLEDPLRLFEDENLNSLPVRNQPEIIDRYQHDATILAGSFDISSEEMDYNKKIIGNINKINPRSIARFLPSFDQIYAGLANIFNFASYLSSEHNLKTTIYILKSDKDAKDEHDKAGKMFPALLDADFVAITPNQIDKIKAHDLGIATLWSTAYPLARSTNIKLKYYFIQDNEVNFYPKGTISSLVEMTYRFGFTAIAGTEGLLNMYKEQYNGEGIVLKSKVDLSNYHPRKDLHYAVTKPYRVFFYARPNMPRNAFELGIAGLKILKEELNKDVEIITAGAYWDENEYGVEGLFNNLGKIAYDAVPMLYRSVDAGLMFMFSGHPGVTASELMASGCPVVVNEYNDVTWNELYIDGETCLITLSTASEIARNLRRCLEDKN